jgi:hypothetical protein
VQECRKYEETKDWSFVASLEEALLAPAAKEPATL